MRSGYRRRKRSTTPGFPNQILASRQHRRMCNSIAIESKLRLDSGTTGMCQNRRGRGTEGRSYPLRCGADSQLSPRKRLGGSSDNKKTVAHFKDAAYSCSVSGHAPTRRRPANWSCSPRPRRRDEGHRRRQRRHHEARRAARAMLFSPWSYSSNSAYRSESRIDPWQAKGKDIFAAPIPSMSHVAST